MTSKEILHIVPSRHVLMPQAITTLDTTALDLINYESGSFLFDIAASNLSASNYATFTLYEADASGGPFTLVDNMFLEWFQDGVPGGVTGNAGSQVWTPSIPGATGALVLNTESSITNHTYGVSYVGGQHRYIRLHMAPTGSPTNVLAVLGLLGAPRETAGKAYTTYPTYP